MNTFFEERQSEVTAPPISRILKVYMATDLTHEEVQLARACAPPRAAYVKDGLMVLMAALEKVDAERARQLYRTQLDPLARAAIGLSKQVTDQKMVLAAEESNLAEEINRTVGTVMVLAMAITLLLGVVVAIGNMRSITRSINEAVKAAATAAAADVIRADGSCG